MGCTLWSMATDCPDTIVRFANFCGFASAALMFVRFAPQLYTSCVTRTAGSISYITYMVLGIGGFLSSYFQIFASKEKVTTWLPVFVGNCFQTSILLVCASNDFFCR